ncbi:MAG TPA: hypothetical protein VF132_00040, partial [Rudaea sp.]
LVAFLPVGFILDLLVWVAFFQYGLEVLRWSANGRTQAPEISFSVSDAIARYAMLLFVLIETVLMLLSYAYGPFAALGVGLVLMAAAPAMVIILALEEGMARALNPIAWLSLMARLGRTYFVLAGFFCLALLVQSVVAAGILKILPELLAAPLIFFVVNYLMIVNFHLIGWVIHEHADELGYSGHLEFQQTPADASSEDKTIDAARRRAASGDAAGAATLLRDELISAPNALALHEEYRHWVRTNEDNAELLQHGTRYIDVLMAQGKERRALEIVRECQQIDPAFALDDAAAITELAHTAADIGQAQLALGLVSGFHKRFRNHPDIARNYLLAAKLFAERMNKEMQARAMLQQIKIVLPNDPIVPQVDAYLAFLDKVAATKKPAPPDP